MSTDPMPAPTFPALLASLGFYPVVPDAQWVEQLLQWGVRTVQLRFKAVGQGGDDAAGAHAVAQQVRAAVAAGRAVPGAQVFINDHWRQAMAEGAYGVHLGQEDWAALNDAERADLRASGMRLGLSTHTPQELAWARSAGPSYLAIGPVYPTTLKVMPYEPVGLQRLKLWVPQAGGIPVVAIGGISLQLMADVLACGVDGVAVVSAVTQAQSPQEAARQGLEICMPAQ